MPFLKEDIYGKLNRGKLYAKKGTEVHVTNRYGGLLTVIPVGETLGFAVFPEELTDYDPVKDAPPGSPPPAPDPAPAPLPSPRKQKSAKPSAPDIQTSLF